MPFKLRVRKTIKIAPGFKTTITHRGVSSTIGGKAGRVTVGRRGVRVASTAGPVVYEKRIGGKRKAAAPQRRRRWWLLWLA